MAGAGGSNPHAPSRYAVRRGGPTTFNAASRRPAHAIFLITSLLLDEHDGTGRIDLRSFYLRRILRLYPAVLVMTIAGGVLHTLLPGRTWGAFSIAALGVLFYAANVMTAFSHNGGAMDGLGHTWTLAMEEQFYIVWPIILVVALRKRGYWLPILLIVVGIAVSFVSLGHNGPPTSAGIPQAYFRPDSRVIGLLIGCLSAFTLRYDSPRRIAANNEVGLVGVALLALTVIAAGRWNVAYLSECVPAASIATALVVVAVAMRRGLLARTLSWRPLRWLGLISYGVYVYSGLFNTVTAQATTSWPTWQLALLRTGVAIVIATASYFLIERPIRGRGRERFDLAPTRGSAT
jgi:peptidoglycan/LPS O-acetylase OafA/YrhL